MALNNIGDQKYDNQGMCEGTLLTSLNDIGTQKYDNQGLPEGFIGTSGGRVRLLLSLGVGT